MAIRKHAHAIYRYTQIRFSALKTENFIYPFYILFFNNACMNFNRIGKLPEAIYMCIPANAFEHCLFRRPWLYKSMPCAIYRYFFSAVKIERKKKIFLIVFFFFFFFLLKTFIVGLARKMVIRWL